MLRLMRFGVYFERILKIKWLFSYRYNYSIVTRINTNCTHIYLSKIKLFVFVCFRDSGAHAARENYENMVQFGCVLVYI